MCAWTWSRLQQFTVLGTLKRCSTPSLHLRAFLNTSSAQIPALRDHRHVGLLQQLFTFNDLSPGSAFFLPHGTQIVNKLVDMLKYLYRAHGYDEVITPQLYKHALWEQSGHWDNYKDDMFAVLPGQPNDPSHHTCAHFAHSQQHYGLKPMNCPGHCLLFDHVPRTLKHLPLRLADFSPLHRYTTTFVGPLTPSSNEASGALSGLTRVRRFHQDDAHIFCTFEQISDEIAGCLKMVDQVYKLFEFPSWNYVLATRPENAMGDLKVWDTAEMALRNVLDHSGRDWQEKLGDGAFYGPKIDITVQDASGKAHQTATIQLDFQLPQRFKLEYERITCKPLASFTNMRNSSKQVQRNTCDSASRYFRKC